MNSSALPGADGAAEPIGLIGGIGLTEVRVYAQRRAPDGTFSGCPHVHAVTDEAYFVLDGRGSVEFHDRTHGFRTLPLEPGQYVHFPPRVIHRLISNGQLVILGIMGNAGLAERGEARIYFGPEVDVDPARFEELLSLPKRLGLEGALQRRDAAVQGYQHLLKLWCDDRDAYFAELNRFIDLHCHAMSRIADTLAQAVVQGPLAQANATMTRIASLPMQPDVDTDVVLNRRAPDAALALGMCGTLRPIISLTQLARNAT